MAAGEILFVSGEPLWPCVHGGRIRGARLIRELARRLPVRVIAPLEGEPEMDVPFVELPPSPPTGQVQGRVDKVIAVTSGKPRLGHALFDRTRQAMLRDVVTRQRPRAVVFAHSYLAAMAPGCAVHAVVDFVDVEGRRMASLATHGPLRARAAHGWEAIKARRWEPVVARRAALCAAVTQADVELISSWGAKAVLVPHGADPVTATASPADGPVTYVASFGYGPNRQAATAVLEEVWPRLRQAEPGLRLQFVGRQADGPLRRSAERAGIEVVSDPESVERYYEEASLVLAPVQHGGGAQLKLTEALAHGRIVVASPFSARSAPRGAGPGVVVADGAGRLAEQILYLWRDRAERHRREDSLVKRRPVPTWEETCAPLVEALSGVVSGR